MFYSVPVIDGPDAAFASISDMQHVRETENAIEKDCDALTVNGDGRIWVALRKYHVENVPFWAVIFCDENYDDYQVGISDNEAEALKEYTSAVLILADQAVEFAKTTVKAPLINSARSGKVPAAFKSTSFLRL